MALELYMLGLVTRDMGKSLEFYRRLGLDIPEGGEEKTHVEVKMGNGLIFFLDSKPALWDPGFIKQSDTAQTEAEESYPFLLEFYLESQTAVDARYSELTGFGYQSRRAPYKTSFGMYFAMVNDPDGNTILLSGNLEEHKSSQEE